MVAEYDRLYPEGPPPPYSGLLVAPLRRVMRWPFADRPGLRAWRNIETGQIAFYARYTSDPPDRLPPRMERDYEHG
jgi:hypothetical protein